MKNLVIVVCVYCVCLFRTINTGNIVCPEHETLDECKNPCQPTCQEPTPPICEFLVCQPGCVCETGFIRDEVSGKCIDCKNCPQVCAKDEEPNPGGCEPTCQHLFTKLLCIYKPCVCKSGLLRDLTSGKCVKPECCPNECGVNEEWNSCTNPDCRKTCQNRFNWPAILCQQVCTPGCRCKDGYLWDEKSQQCVTERDCPNVCGVNEEWNLCTTPGCSKTCQNRLKPLEICAQVCIPGCKCKEGYLWDEESKQCVPECDCPEECGENEERKKCCDVNCRGTCQNPKPEVCSEECQTGCSCKDGYIWDEYSKKCINSRECPKSSECSKNEEWKECSDVNCRATCQNAKPEVCAEVCIAGCSCKNGYIWDEDSKECVRLRRCPKKCSKNEEWRECSDLNCRKTCKNPTPEVCPDICIAGCTCKDGYIWDDHRKECIRPRHCPKECHENEEWRECSDVNCRETCQNPKPEVCPFICISGCSCQEGYIWDEHLKKCVLRDQCSKKCDEHEEWRECSDRYCRETCQNQGQIINCPKIRCLPGCSCKENFIWDEQQNKCVRKKDCSNLCKENEEWKQCSDIKCRRTCQRPRLKICPKICIPGCSCKDGYIWDEHLGKCVFRFHCSKVCGENQEWCEYVPDDEPTCQSLSRPKAPGSIGPTIVTLTPRCTCIKDFIWDEISETCISLKDCATT